MTTPSTEWIWLGTEAERLAADPSIIPDPLAIVRSEAGFFVPDGVTPLRSLAIPYATPDYVTSMTTQLAAAIQALAARPVPAPRSVNIAPVGNFALGATAQGPIVNVGFNVAGVRVRVDSGPTGSQATAQIIDSAGNTYPLGGTPYLITIPAGSGPYLFDDLNAGGWALTDGAQLKLNWTQIGSTFAGSGIAVELIENVGGSTGGGIGSVTGVTASTIGGASVTLSWQYTGTNPASSFLVVTKQGTVAPSSQTDGTALTVDGAAAGAQVTGLTANTTYSFSVWPVASDGTSGTPGTLTGVTTVGVDSSPPGPVTSTSYAAGATALTPSWTNPTDADFDHVIARIKINTTIPFATIANNTQPSEGHPAATPSPTAATGSGTALPPGVTSFTQTGLNPSENYVIGLWTVDAAGNINGAPVSIQCTTTPAATGGQGLTGMVPSTYNKVWPTTTTDPIQSQNLSAYISANDKKAGLGAGFHGYANGTEGATAQENVGTMVDPLLGAGHYAMYMKMNRFKGWADSTSSVYKNNQGWFYINGTSPAQYTTDGTGWYGARVQNYAAPSQAWGAWDIEWWIANLDGTAATAIGTHSKGITIMLFPDNNWPKREVDYVEIPSGFPQSNIHYQTTSGGNGQLNTTATPSGLTLPNIFAPLKTTLLLEPPPAGTGGTGGLGRCRVFHQQTGTAGGAVQTWFDTDKPYICDAADKDDTKMTLFLQQAQVGHIGIAVAYQASSLTIDSTGKATGANFSATTGTGTNQRTGHMALIRSITQWGAA